MPRTVLVVDDSAAFRATAQVLLKARGYEFVTVSELLAAGEPVTSPTCYDSQPGDADRWPFRHRAPVAAAPSGFVWPWQSVAQRR